MGIIVVVVGGGAGGWGGEVRAGACNVKGCGEGWEKCANEHGGSGLGGVVGYQHPFPPTLTVLAPRC